MKKLITFLSILFLSTAVLAWGNSGGGEGDGNGSGGSDGGGDVGASVGSGGNVGPGNGANGYGDVKEPRYKRKNFASNEWYKEGLK